MQQQFFKTMDHAFFGSKCLQGSKVGKARAQPNQKSTKQYVELELSDQQFQAMQPKLPRGFFLINPYNGDLQKLRSETRLNFVQKDSTGSKHNLIKAKKEQKKVDFKDRLPLLQAEKKPEQKAADKPTQLEKSKKDKKDIKAHSRKLIQHKPSLDIQQNVPELIQQIQKEELDRNQEEARRKHKQAKEKKHPKEQPIEKQPIQAPNKIQVQHVDKQPEKITPKPQSTHPREPLLSHEGHLSIPFLANNKPRYDPAYHHSETQGNSEENTLCYMFGLPFSGPISEIPPRLNEKQKKFCNNIIQRLKNHRSSQAFRVAVDPLSQGVPDYYSIVYTPMDLKTIEKKLNKDRYHFISEFHSDINMIFLNSYKYNLRETVYFEATVEFEDYYHELLRQAKKNPDEYTKEYVSKFNKSRNDSGELDYTEHTPKKHRKKNEISKGGLNITKSQMFERQRKSTKLIKNKSAFQDQSGALSQSFALETIYDFNVEGTENESKPIPRREEKEPSKLRRVESIQMGAQQILSQNQETMVAEKPSKPVKQKLQMKQKKQSEIINAEVMKSETKKEPVIEEPIYQLQSKSQKSKRFGNDDYNDEDHYLMENFDCAFQLNSQNSCANKGASMIFEAMNPAGNMEAERVIEDMIEHVQPAIQDTAGPPGLLLEALALPEKKMPKVSRKYYKQARQQKKKEAHIKKPKDQKVKQQQVMSSSPVGGQNNSEMSIAKETPKFNMPEFHVYNPPFQPHNFESIIVNNINALPQYYAMNPNHAFHGSVDMFTENTEHPNSGATVTLTNNSTPMEPKLNPATKVRKTKQKVKHVDEQYRCESDDDYVISSSRAHVRKTKDKKITKSRLNKDSSNSGDNVVFSTQRRRGRQPKKIVNQTSLEQGKSVSDKEQNQHGPQQPHENTYQIPNIDALELPNFIPEVMIPSEGLLPFGGQLQDYQENEGGDNEGSLFYQTERHYSNQPNQQNMPNSKMD